MSMASWIHTARTFVGFCLTANLILAGFVVFIGCITTGFWLFLASGFFLILTMFFLVWTALAVCVLFVGVQVAIGFSEDGLSGATKALKTVGQDSKKFMHMGKSKLVEVFPAADKISID